MGSRGKTSGRGHGTFRWEIKKILSLGVILLYVFLHFCFTSAAKELVWFASLRFDSIRFDLVWFD